VAVLQKSIGVAFARTYGFSLPWKEKDTHSSLKISMQTSLQEKHIWIEGYTSCHQTPNVY